VRSFRGSWTLQAEGLAKGMGKMRVLAVDQEAVCSADRGFYRALGQTTDVSMTLVVPKCWKEQFGVRRFEQEAGPLPVIASEVIFAGKSHRALYVSLRQILLKTEPDILYVNAEPESFLAWHATVLRRRVSPRTKVVFASWRNIEGENGVYPYRLRLLNLHAEKVVLKGADQCIARSLSARDIFVQKGFSNTTVIPPCVDTMIFRPLTVGAAPAPRSNVFTVGYIGRFSHLKGVDLLLLAAKKLQAGYRIRLVGDGPAKLSWAKLANSLGLNRNIEWLPPVDHGMVPELVRTFDVLVLPSRTSEYWKEQFGRVLIEAMACGVPVIGSSSGEIPHVIGDAGLVFKEGDAQGLALGIQRLMDDEMLRKELIRKGLERANARYAVPVVAAEYHSLFEKLLKATPVD
jgi:glycosyltransferase involved in cell wall biosynthesis